MLDWLVAQGVVRVDAHIHPEHAASTGVARIAGLTPTGETLDGETAWRLCGPNRRPARDNRGRARQLERDPGSSNGKTRAFGAWNGGSTPPPGTGRVCG